jgi:S1-C subfamily serine protease
MNWVDVLLLVVVATAAVRGLRLGAALQLLSYGGFLLGFCCGVLLAPRFANLVRGAGERSVVALVVVGGSALLFGGAGHFLGVRFSFTLRRWHVGNLDQALGVAVAVIVTLVVSWLVVSLLANSRFASVDAAIQQARVIRAIDRVMPPLPSVFAQVETFLDNENFPVVFTGLPPQIAGPVALPNIEAVQEGVSDAGSSTVQIVGQGCGVIQEGSGFVIAHDLVVTNAHVVAGVRNPQVIDQFGTRYATVPVWFDPEEDLAVLRVPGLPAPPLTLATTLFARNTQGVVLGFPEGGPFTYGGAGVMAEFDATGLDIYGTERVTRAVYELDGIVRPGNSGGPFVSPQGTVLGIVFARSTTDPDVGYALAFSPAVIQELQDAESATAQTGTGVCTSG